MSCGVGHRRDWDLILLWLWRRSVAIPLIQPPTWGPPYALGAALKRKKKKKIYETPCPARWAMLPQRGERMGPSQRCYQRGERPVFWGRCPGQNQELLKLFPHRDTAGADHLIIGCCCPLVNSQSETRAAAARSVGRDKNDIHLPLCHKYYT